MPSIISKEIDHLLETTSRSFFITLKNLPRKIRRQLSLLYLLARIADTIADSSEGQTKWLMENLQTYNSIIKEQITDMSQLKNFKKIHANPSETYLLQNSEEVIKAITIFQENDQQKIRSCLDIIISGQILDLERFGISNEDGKISQVSEDRRVHRILWLRTLEIAFFVTILCFLMAYPIAHLLATLPMKYSNLLMICVLLPFWTSLLVRTASWMILLQQQGIVNDFFVWIGLVGEENRPEMMYNKTGTYVAMTQILLPFMVLPLYSVMKTISPSLMRAGKSLGGTPFVAFWKVYFPLTIPGIGAGCLLVFILAIGYYITPALVGGASGTLISNQIAFHMKSTLDWSFASAMGLMLLTGVLVIYWIYNKLVGVDNIKLG